MIIYQNTKAGFIDDVDENRLQGRLEQAFTDKTGSVPADRGVWDYEYTKFSRVLGGARVDPEVQVAIEYFPSVVGRSRVDVVLAGNDGTTDQALILELKAWDQAGLRDEANMVLAPYGGGRVKEHPCLQAKHYRVLVQRFNQDVEEQGIVLHSGAYLFNLHRRTPEPLEDARYQDLLTDSRLFLAGDTTELKAYFETHIPRKPQKNVLFYLDQGRWRPAEALLRRVDAMLKGNESFELIDEQNEAFEIIRHKVIDEKDRTGRHVFVVEGGPGTGKSVIAVRLVAEALKRKRMAFFVAPNKAFRDALVEQLSEGNSGYRDDGQALFRSSWSFDQADWRRDEKNEILVIDEAHRLKEQAYQYRGESMIEDMVRAARISVFFIDESQKIEWKDAGSVEAVRVAAKKFKAEWHEPMKLTAQFRCHGSTGYTNWLVDTLQLGETGNYDGWPNLDYDFQIFANAHDLYEALKARNTTNTARLVAGYAWNWPQKGRERGSAAAHIQVDGLSLPWNYFGESWGTAADGIGQVGCIHTCQGLEFDTMGILIGGDLVYREGQVVGLPEKRAKTDRSLYGYRAELKAAGEDPRKHSQVLGKIQTIIKNTYKVLLSRGRKGCYVWCEDAALREYLKHRLELAKVAPDCFLRPV